MHYIDFNRYHHFQSQKVIGLKFVNKRRSARVLGVLLMAIVMFLLIAVMWGDKLFF